MQPVVAARRLSRDFLVSRSPPTVSRVMLSVRETAFKFRVLRMRWVAADDARRLVCAADRPDARRITDRCLRAGARLLRHDTRRVRHARRAPRDRERSERVSAVVPDPGPLVTVRAQVA